MKDSRSAFFIRRKKASEPSDEEFLVFPQFGMKLYNEIRKKKNKKKNPTSALIFRKSGLF